MINLSEVRVYSHIGTLLLIASVGCATDVRETVGSSYSELQSASGVELVPGAVVSLEALGEHENSCAELMGPDLQFFEVAESDALVACVDPTGVVVCVDTVDGVAQALEELGDAVLADFDGMVDEFDDSFYADGSASESTEKTDQEEQTSSMNDSGDDDAVSGDPSPQPSAVAGGDPSPQPSVVESGDPSPQPSNDANSGDPSPQPSSAGSDDPSPQPSNDANSGDPSPQPSSAGSDDPSPQPSATGSTGE